MADGHHRTNRHQIEEKNLRDGNGAFMMSSSSTGSGLLCCFGAERASPPSMLKTSDDKTLLRPSESIRVWVLSFPSRTGLLREKRAMRNLDDKITKHAESGRKCRRAQREIH